MLQPKILSLFLLIFQTTQPTNFLKQEKINTPLTEIQLAKTLQKSYFNVFEDKPNDYVLANSWAHIAFENGSGKHIYNHNLGNLGAKENQLYYLVAGNRFKSFSSFQEGAKAYWKHLKNKCQMALNYFKYGDTKTASLALKKCGYYRADIKFYTKNLVILTNKAYKKILPKIK